MYFGMMHEDDDDEEEVVGSGLEPDCVGFGSGLDEAVIICSVGADWQSLIKERSKSFVKLIFTISKDGNGSTHKSTTLIGGVALGFVNPTLGCMADKYYLSKVSTFCIFIISGLTLRSKEIGEVAEAWPAGLFRLTWYCLLR